ncbi:GNAT family N-acetyltransferase [Cohnella nanjingensis]|uniref:GNAT family N-acetyltransferase n=1 Tax=Cohnella nanjingensis TaxID=1387779 RepID=A0A7X0RRJ4_9BACL|nr:GNAT family N-acetyltransferase [Cohnella nanjingensis]MBB6672332.1 GNAT family N-acetyltransferase [Cohnella nanjingensis]
MIVRLLTSEEWDRSRFAMLRFVLRHGERRITQAGWRRMVTASAATLAEPGTAVAVAFTACGQPAGVAFAQGYGEGACVVAVHPALRGRGIGRRLLQHLAEPWGRLSCSVASDNPASLAMCYAAGFAASGTHAGPTGKPTLRLVWRPGAPEAEPAAAPARHRRGAVAEPKAAVSLTAAERR